MTQRVRSYTRAAGMSASAAISQCGAARLRDYIKVIHCFNCLGRAYGTSMAVGEKERHFFSSRVREAGRTGALPHQGTSYAGGVHVAPRLLGLRAASALNLIAVLDRIIVVVNESPRNSNTLIRVPRWVQHVGVPDQIQ